MAAVKTIFAHTEPDAIDQQWDQVADTLAASFPEVAVMREGAKEHVLAFGSFPQSHWQRIWSNNPIVICSPSAGVFHVDHDVSTGSCLLAGRSYLRRSMKQILGSRNACREGALTAFTA